MHAAHRDIMTAASNIKWLQKAKALVTTASSYGIIAHSAMPERSSQSKMLASAMSLIIIVEISRGE